MTGRSTIRYVANHAFASRNPLPTLKAEAHQLTRKQIFELCKNLQAKDFKRSITILGNFSMFKKQMLPLPNFYVDQWPHPQAVLARYTNDYIKDLTQFVLVYSKSPAALHYLLHRPGIIDWTKATRFVNCQQDEQPFILEYCSSKAKQNHGIIELNKSSNKFLVGIRLQNSKTPVKLHTRELPKGLNFSSPTESQAKDFLNKFNTFEDKAILLFMIRNKMHNYAIVDQDKRILTMCGTYPWNEDSIYTSEKCKTRFPMAPAHILSYSTRQKFYHNDEFAYCGVEDNNIEGIRTLINAGYDVQEWNTASVNYLPRGNNPSA